MNQGIISHGVYLILHNIPVSAPEGFLHHFICIRCQPIGTRADWQNRHDFVQMLTALNDSIHQWITNDSGNVTKSRSSSRIETDHCFCGLNVALRSEFHANMNMLWPLFFTFSLAHPLKHSSSRLPGAPRSISFGRQGFYGDQGK